ncbi:MAG: transposase [Waltera sp.]
MSTKQHYDEDFKRTLVELYHNGKTQASLIKEYGVSQTALSRWVKQYSTVETDDGEVLTAKQVKRASKTYGSAGRRKPNTKKKRLPYSRHTQATIRCRA